MEQTLPKKTPKLVKCSDCSKQIAANTNKAQLLCQHGVREETVPRCLDMCEHPMCSDCVKKTTNRVFYEIGACDQCMWWAIT